VGMSNKVWVGWS